MYSLLGVLSERKIKSMNCIRWTFTLCAVVVPSLLWNVTAASGVEIFIVAGQSNADGVAPSAGLPSSLTNQTDVPYWFRTRNSSSGNAFSTLSPSPANGQFGPELSLGRTLADALPEDIVIVKVTNSGIPLVQRSGTDWSPDSSGEAFDLLISNVLAAQTNLINAGETPRIAGLFWMQGESDAKSGIVGTPSFSPPPPQPSTANAYEANLTNFIASVRNDLGVTDLPVFIGEINIGDNPAITNPVSDYNTIVGQWDFTPTIQAAQAAVAGTDPNAYLIETDSLGHISDFVHFDQAGQVALGEAFAASYLATIPEPSCLILLATGMVTLCSSRTRRRHV